MTLHPKERGGHTRRDLLARAGGAALGLSSAGSLLAACSNSTAPGGASGGSTGTEQLGPGGLPLARPDQARDDAALGEADRLGAASPRRAATFEIFNYPDYLYPKLLKEFCAKYNVTPVYTPFDNIASGIQRLASGSVSPDVMEMTPDNLDQVVAGKLIKPLNLDYIPNLQKNIWPQLVSPFYDVGSRYTVPYTCYATGILWRNDHVKQDIAGMKQPWDIFWESQAYSGKVALLSEDRETIAMALLRRGITDINTEDPKLINRAVSDLKQLYSICNIKVGDSSTRRSPRARRGSTRRGRATRSSAYFYYLPKGTPASVMSYWKAPKGHVPMQNDCWSICSTTKKPVLSHLWLNYIIDNGVAYSNFVNFNGYQPPLNEIDPDTLVPKGVIPENLHTRCSRTTTSARRRCRR